MYLVFPEYFSYLTWKLSKLKVQWSVLLMQSSIVRYCINNCMNSGRISKAGPTKDTPYLTLTGELWDVFWEYLWENWLRYKGTTLYQVVFQTLVVMSEQSPFRSLQDRILVCYYLDTFFSINWKSNWNLLNWKLFVIPSTFHIFHKCDKITEISCQLEYLQHLFAWSNSFHEWRNFKW